MMRRDSVSVILARPENPENIGLVARAMKNTGFRDLRITNVRRLGVKAYKTAVHAGDILENVRLFQNLDAAVADLHVIFAATAKPRKNFPSMTLSEAREKMSAFTRLTKIGLLFGNERTGLTSEEMRCSNYRFTIPQASRQPSYNLAAAVLLALFYISVSSKLKSHRIYPRPLPRRDQEACIRMICNKLADKGFIHKTNKNHVTEMVHDLFGRIALTEKDKNLLLALFSKGPDAYNPSSSLPSGGCMKG